MICKFPLLTATLALGVSGSASAALLVTESSAPTTGLAGYTTYTLELSTDAGQITSLGGDFTGPLNQVNPFGVLVTIFNDNNVAFGVTPIDNDSQFLFNSNNVLEVDTAEGPTSLKASFTGFTPFVSQDIVQLVIPDGQSVDYTITAVVDGSTELRVTGTTPIPEPGSLALLGVAGLGLIARRRRVA